MKNKKVVILCAFGALSVAALLIGVFSSHRNIKTREETTESSTTVVEESEEESTRPSVTFVFDEETGELIISCSKKVLALSDIKTGFNLPELTKTVIINEGPQVIAQFMFEDFANLERVVLPSSVETVCEGAFKNCTALKEINLENVVEIDAEAFYNCTSVESLLLSEKTDSVSVRAFKDCTSLKKVTIKNRNISLLSPFEGCSALSDVECDFELSASGVKDFKGTPFYEKQTEYIDGLTYYKNGIIDFNPDYKGVCRIKDGVKVIDSSDFENNTGITEIIIPDSVETFDAIALVYFEGVKKVSVGKGVKEIFYDSFHGTPVSIEEYYVDPENKYFLSDEYGVLFTKDKKTIIAYPCGNKRTEYSIPDSVVSVEGAFDFCPNLKTIIIGRSVSAIKNCIFDSEYQGYFTTCDSLQKIIVSNDNPYYCSDENGILYDKNKKTLILVPPACQVTEFNIPDSVTTIRTGAFYAALSIKKLYIGKNIKKFEEYCLCGIDSETGSLTVGFEIYYAGTEKQWKELSASLTGYEVFTYPEIHFNSNPFASTTQPVTQPTARSFSFLFVSMIFP